MYKEILLMALSEDVHKIKLKLITLPLILRAWGASRRLTYDILIT